MITTLIRYILFLILFNSALVAQEEDIDISFEVLHVKKDYMDIAEKKLQELKRKGLDCTLVQSKEDISLQCNNSHTLQQMQENINKLQKKGIAFSIINKNKTTQKKRYKSPYRLAIAYKAYNNKEYYKAYNIFSKLYKADKSFENGYGYALALMQLHRYEDALAILKNYKEEKAKKLSKNIINTYLYETLKKQNYKLAYQIIKKYNLGEKQKLEIPYMKALALSKNGAYDAALKELIPYKDRSHKIEQLYNDILYNKYTDKAWSLVKKEPHKAIKYFKDACKIKKGFSCYEGMMYGYYNLKNYKVSLYLAEKLYRFKKDPEIAEMAFHSNLALKNYKEAEKWYLRSKNKRNLQDPFLLTYLEKIDAKLKQKKYDEASILLKEATRKYPDNEELLQREMNLFIVQEDYKAAREKALKLLQKDPKNLDALHTLALYEFEKKNYMACVKLLEDKKLDQSYQRDTLQRCRAYNALEDGNLTKATNDIDKITNTKILYSFYLDLGMYLEKQKNPDALKAYKKAKEYATDDIESELTYLYALQRLQKYKLLEKELAYAYEHFPQEQKKLNLFKKGYEKQKLFHLYQEHKYAECLEYANNMEYKDTESYSLAAWCAYADGQYTIAKREFSNALKDTNTTQNLYGYALSASKLGQRDVAIESLGKIKTFQNEKEKLDVISLYADLQEQDKARELTKTLLEESKKTRASHLIAKSYTKLFYENSASAAFIVESQSGTKGLNQFDKYGMAIDYDHYSDGLHMYIDTDFLYLDKGRLSYDTDYESYGYGTTTQINKETNTSVFIPKFGIDYKNYHFTIGTTPWGGEISPELTAMLSTYFEKNRWLGTIKIEQRELDETMLSFVGENAQENNQDIYWGRVLKRGGSIGIHYQSILDLSLDLGYYPQIYGHNVLTNSEIKATFIAIYYPEVNDLDYMQIGFLGLYDSYDKNENLFTYGHGGYFSPQSFIMAGVFTEFGDHLNKDLYYKSKLALGFEKYSVDAAQKFPLNDNIGNASDMVNAYNSSGLDYKFAFQLGYKINKKFDFISGISFEQFQNYSIHEISFGFVYRFQKHYNDFNTFYLNHRVDQIIPRYEVAK